MNENNITALLNEIKLMNAELLKGNSDYCFNTDIFQGEYKDLAEIILELTHLGMRDQLTGISNRRCFDNRLDLEWGRAMRHQENISMLMIDIDKFKSYNDSFGHQQGDAALRAMGMILTQTIKRHIDFVARWGGEEFAVLLPGTDAAGAKLVAELIRKNVERMVIPSDNEKAAKITVSIGVNSQVPTYDDPLVDFVAGTDEALYRAKNNGRNRVCSYN